jgi:hypothetical protein
VGILRVAGQRATAGDQNQYYGFADTAATTVTAATQQPLTTSYSIPAGEPVVGSAYEILFGGNGTWGSTQQLIAFTITLQGVAVVNTVNGIQNTAFAVNAGFRFSGRAVLICDTTGAAGKFHGNLLVVVTESANPVNPGTAANNTVSIGDASAVLATIDTTSGMAALVKCGWASTTGAPTITNRSTHFRKTA